MMKFALLSRAGLGLIAAVFSSLACSQAFPSKPIRMITEFGVGSGGDIILRVVTTAMTETLGQAIALENRAGAGGVLAAEVVVRAAPDGYTLGTYSPNALVTRRVLAKGGSPIDVLRDLTPITALGDAVMLVFVQPGGAIKSLRELIDYAKQNPGKLSYGSSGVGSTQHLDGEILKLAAGISMVHVPYKGGGPQAQAVLAQEIDVSLQPLLQVRANLGPGRINLLAVYGRGTRFAGLPAVPDIAETLPAFQSMPTWVGLLGPAGLPRPIVLRLHAAALKALNAPEVRPKVEENSTLIANSPDEFADILRADREITEKLVNAVKAAGVRFE